MPDIASTSTTITRPMQPVQFAHQINTILTSDNYLLWKLQVVPVLRSHGLFGFVDGSSMPPEQFLLASTGSRMPNPDYEQWIRQDQLILAWIFNSLSPPLLAQVVNCETAAQVWQLLKQIYNSQSMAKILEFKLKLQTIRKGSDTCAQYLQKIQSIADQLRSIGAPVSDQDLILHTLQGLGTEFEEFVTAISMCDEAVAMGQLQSLLLAHESHQRSQLHASAMALNTQQGAANLGQETGPLSRDSTTQNNNSAFQQQALAAQQTPQPYNSNYQGRSNSNSNRRGSARGRGRGRQNYAPKEDIYCQICTKWVHPAYKCHHRFDIYFTGPTSQPQQAPPRQMHQALLAEPAAPSPSSAWFLDSGATTHVTSDINNLSSSQIYSDTDMVHVGNGSGTMDDDSAKSSTVKRQKMIDVGVDFLSLLPDELIAHILSFLNTKEANKICLRLSRRFRHLWTLVPALHFDIDDFLPDELQMLSLMEEELLPYEEKFVNFVAYMLENHAHMTVDAFSVKWKKDEGDSTPATAWFETVGALWKPKILSIRILAESVNFDFPHSIFTCESLEELVLNLDFDGLNLNYVNLPHLKRLTLDNMCITDEVMPKLLLGLPALKEMVLQLCDLEFSVFSSGTLKCLVLNGLDWDDVNLPNLLISIPSLLFLKVCSLVKRRLKFKELGSLAEAHIHLEQISVVEPSFLMDISNVTSLELVLTESCLKDAPAIRAITFPRFDNMKSLRLGGWDWSKTNIRDGLWLLSCLLFHAPHLKKLTLLHRNPMSDSNIEITVVLGQNFDIVGTIYSEEEEKSASEKVIEMVREVLNIIRQRVSGRMLVS